MVATEALPHLLDLRHLSRGAWDGLLHDAERLAGPRGREPLLRGRRLGMLFFQPSLRTRVAFEVACFDLGAHAVHLQVGGGLWNLEHRDGVVMDGDRAEHVREAVGVLGRLLDGLGVRCFAGLVDARADAADEVLHAIARHATVPVLSLESAMDHPHQGLADALTVRRRFGEERVRVALTWAPHVKPLPLAVPHAALLAFAREGHEVVVAHPPGYDLDEGVLDDARRLAGEAGGRVEVTHQQAAALAGARVVYAKSWGARAHYGDGVAAQGGFRAHADWRVTAARMAATDHAVFLHCLPLRRGVVADADVLDAPSCLVLDQAEARLHVQKATLCRALGVRP
jgi:N-acetylornithine carbamoyltransferase